MPRFTSRFLVDLLVREVQAAGGFAAILTKGDEHSGAILIQCAHRGEAGPLLERRASLDGKMVWESVGPVPPADENSRLEYQQRRRRADPDLWIVELDIAGAQQLAARILCAG